jgi:rubrerythrin
MKEQMENLLYEALETEIGGVQVYTNAVRCAQNDDLKEEWEKYLEQTMRHEQILREVMETLGLDAEKETPGRKVVRHIGESLVQAMTMAREEGEPEAAQIVAAECVVLAETKDHQNWELLGEVAKKLTGEEKKAISEAHDEVEDEEDEHLYHTQGWSRELWLDHLGMAAVLPPPEEKKDVKTAIGAARAKQSRKAMTRGGRKGGRPGAPAEH